MRILKKKSNRVSKNNVISLYRGDMSRQKEFYDNCRIKLPSAIMRLKSHTGNEGRQSANPKEKNKKERAEQIMERAQRKRSPSSDL